MAHRFFVESRIASDHASLIGAEAHHLLHVLRMGVGDEVILFDGSGSQFSARIEQTGRRQVDLRVLQRQPIDVELSDQLIIGVALPKADRQRWLVEKLTELGATRLVPLRTHRSVVHPNDKALHKLRRAVIEASKQCGRNRLMQVEHLTRLHDFLTAAPLHAERWLGHAAGVVVDPGRAAGPIHIAVGPEGGFSDREVEDAQRLGWRAVSLGPTILRIETASLALATLAAQRLFR
jgi:16S rRNA (uracil1498-N3)-methyltransferase